MGQNPNNGTSSPANGKKDFQNLIDECNRLKNENKFLKNEIESIKNINNKVTKNNQNLARKSAEDHEQYKKGYETCKRIIVDLQNGKNEIVKEKNFFESKHNELKQKYDEQNINLQELKQEKKNFEYHYNELKQQLKEKESQIRSLKQKNDELEDEASNYQSALGIATDFNLNDDENHNVKLNKDILELHDTLENYVTNLKSKVDININEAKKLLLKYGCQTNISDKEPNKPLIKAVLQRHVLEEILKQANFYFTSFTHSNKDHHLESQIVSQTTVLTNLIERFYNNRLGDDEITHLTPIRLRQVVFTALGTRGFNYIKNSDSENSNHNFINIISKRINKMMNKYRTIKDIERRKYVNALSEDLVRNVIRIFYFRLLIQEPVAQYHWFKNYEKINKSYMKGSWDESDVENMVVEVCSFPLILKPSHSGGFKIFTPAKVFPRHIVKQSFKEQIVNIGMSIGSKLKNMYGDLYKDEYDIEQTEFPPTET